MCGEVVCGNCSLHKKVEVNEINTECKLRICSGCLVKNREKSTNISNGIDAYSITFINKKFIV